MLLTRQPALRMMLFNLLLCLVTASLVTSNTIGSKKFRPMGRSIPRKDFVQLQTSDAEDSHNLVFAIKQRNLVELDQLLLERSTPGNPLYQQWLTFEEVGQMTSNVEGAKAVEDWLAENNIQVSWKSAHSDYIRATAKISQWEQMLNTKFFQYEDKSRVKSSKKNRVMHRAVEYSLPEHVAPHLHTVFNTVQVPPVYQTKYYQKNMQFENKVTANLRTDAQAATPPQVTVAFLNEFYNMTGLDGNASMSQSVFETGEESFSPTDLTQFQNMYGLKVQAATAPYGFSTNHCNAGNDNTGFDCYEGNLDVQYIMGVAPSIATVYWYVDESETGPDPFVAFATALANTPNPPLVNSISWGSIEQDNDALTMTTFNVEAMKLGAMGVTVTVSSGDNGAAGNYQLCEVPSGSADYGDWTGTPWTGKGYFPSFPATSPYVTAVGATQGPESNKAEIACQSQQGGVITTGGGFSTYTPTPSWQKNATAAFLKKNNAQSGYNPNGRGYPDVSMIGVYYQVVVQGTVVSLFGTSASSPVFAAMVGLVNSARAKQGKGPLGFLNPTLYSFGTQSTYFNDVTSGNNKCMAQSSQGVICCSSGFSCTSGWDPVTGFGSMNYINLLNMFDGKPPINFRPTTSSSSSDDSLSDGALAGIIIGGLAGVVIIAALIYFFACGSKTALAANAV